MGFKGALFLVLMVSTPALSLFFGPPSKVNFVKSNAAWRNLFQMSRTATLTVTVPGSPEPDGAGKSLCLGSVNLSQTIGATS